MTTPGVTPQGWLGKTLAQCKTQVEQGLLSGPLGKSAATEPDGSIPQASMAGQLVALIVDPFAELWDLGSVLYSIFDPGQATAAALDDVASITGTVRNPANYSSVTETCTGVPGTDLPIGRTVKDSTTGVVFQSDADATIVAVPAWAAEIYAVADRVYTAAGVWQATASNGVAAIAAPLLTAPAYAAATTYGVVGVVVSDPATGNLWFVSTAYGGGAGGAISFPATGTPGTTTHAGAGTLVFTLAQLAGTTTFKDTNVGWQFLGTGTGAVDVGCQATVVGQIGSLAGNLTQITTPVFGWTGAYNVLSATIGALQESDTDLRVRREAELHSSGNAAVDAIRAKVLAVGAGTAAPVTSCTVFENTTDETNADGLPPHSVMVLADYGGLADIPALDQEIAQAIWDSVGAGIATSFGNAVGVGYKFANVAVTDSQGNTQLVNWARPYPVEIDVVANVTYDNTAGAFPLADAQALIKGGTLSSGLQVAGSIPTYGSTLPGAKNVWASALVAAIFDGPTDVVPGAQPIPGVLDVAILIDVNPTTPSVSTPIAISKIQRAVFQTANITVNLSGSAP